MKYMFIALILCIAISFAGFIELAGGLDTLYTTEKIKGNDSIVGRAVRVRAGKFTGDFTILARVVSYDEAAICSLYHEVGFDTIHFYNRALLGAFSGQDTLVAAVPLYVDFYPYWRFVWKSYADSVSVLPLFIYSETKQ